MNTIRITRRPGDQYRLYEASEEEHPHFIQASATDLRYLYDWIASRLPEIEAAARAELRNEAAAKGWTLDD